MLFSDDETCIRLPHTFGQTERIREMKSPQSENLYPYGSTVAPLSRVFNTTEAKLTYWSYVPSVNVSTSHQTRVAKGWREFFHGILSWGNIQWIVNEMVLAMFEC